MTLAAFRLVFRPAYDWSRWRSGARKAAPRVRAAACRLARRIGTGKAAHVYGIDYRTMWQWRRAYEERPIPRARRGVMEGRR